MGVYLPSLPPFLSSLVRFYFDLSFLSLFPTLPPRRGELFLSIPPKLLLSSSPTLLDYVKGCRCDANCPILSGNRQRRLLLRLFGLWPPSVFRETIR